MRSRQPFAVYRPGGLCIGPELAAAVCSAMPKGGRVFVLAEAARPREAQWDCDTARKTCKRVRTFVQAACWWTIGCVVYSGLRGVRLRLTG